MKRLLIILAFALPIITIGQEKADSTIMDDFKEFEEMDMGMMEVDSLGLMMESVQMEQQRYQKKLHLYYQESLETRRKVFSWNHASTVVIFWMVIVIVCFGLIFSAIQFRISMINAKNKSKDQQSEPEKGTQTSLKLSMSGVEVNSSVLGIIILVISLGFFYMYLIHVYPIEKFQIDNMEVPTISEEEDSQ